MRIKKSISFPNTSTFQGEIDVPDECPLCHHFISAEEFSIKSYIDNNGHPYLATLNLCHNCYQTFTVLYACTCNNSSKLYSSKLIYAEPVRFEPKHFDKRIESLSPQFLKIYNQALAAESANLDEIAGIGYRKSVEFLVKDFCIHNHSHEADTIMSMPISQCIRTYIVVDQIKTLASRAVWIGNDETHYIRKLEDHDLDDMKEFIEAMVYYVGMDLITESARKIDPVK